MIYLLIKWEQWTSECKFEIQFFHVAWKYTNGFPRLAGAIFDLTTRGQKKALKGELFNHLDVKMSKPYHEGNANKAKEIKCVDEHDGSFVLTIQDARRCSYDKPSQPFSISVSFKDMIVSSTIILLVCVEEAMPPLSEREQVLKKGRGNMRTRFTSWSEFTCLKRGTLWYCHSKPSTRTSSLRSSLEA